MSADFLATMAESSAARLAVARRECALAPLRARALATPPPPRLRASAARFDLIAELKCRSPALGALAGAQVDLAARVCAYADAGAMAISVLTEPTRFDGSLEHLRLAVQALDGRVPVMRKDFLVDPYQVYEARAAGAGGVLLIVRMLAREVLEAMLAAAEESGLFVLLEAFDEADLRVIGEVTRAARGTVLAGLNCRDLTTLRVVPERLEQLAPALPAGLPAVAESGLEDPADAARLARAGYQAALVGGALMRSADPRALAAALLSAGRAARGAV